MKIAIVGSRTFNDKDLALEVIGTYFPIYNIECIISGGAKGADTIGKEIASILNLPYIEYPAEWDNLEVKPCSIQYKNGTPYNALAGFNRNCKIVDEADVVVAFHDGRSHGTKHTLRYCSKVKKKTFIVYF